MFLIEGTPWTFLDDPPPFAHIATLDRRFVIWLEDAGDRTWVPEFNVPLSIMEEVHPWVRGHRHEVEEAWVNEVMMPKEWLSIEAWSEDQVMVVGYERTVNVFGVFAEVGMIEEVGVAKVLFG